MAKAPTGSGVRFTPDATINGPYNYTRADIPIYKTPPVATAPGGMVSTMTPGGPGSNPAPAPKPRGGGGAGAGGPAVRPVTPITGVNNMLNSSQRNVGALRDAGGVGPGGGGVNRTALDNVILGGGIKPSSIPNIPARPTGTGLALGGAGRGNVPASTPHPMPSLPAGAMPNHAPVTKTRLPMVPPGASTPGSPGIGGLAVQPSAPRPKTTINQNVFATPVNPSKIVGTQRNGFANALARPPVR